MIQSSSANFGFRPNFNNSLRNLRFAWSVFGTRGVYGKVVVNNPGSLKLLDDIDDSATVILEPLLHLQLTVARNQLLPYLQELQLDLVARTT